MKRGPFKPFKVARRPGDRITPAVYTSPDGEHAHAGHHHGHTHESPAVLVLAVAVILIIAGLWAASVFGYLAPMPLSAPPLAP